MTTVEKFLTPIEESEIIDAIRDAENHTSGEIRIHIEPRCNADAVLRAEEVFNYLRMKNTKYSNGVLIYIAVEDRTLVILGDSGINEVVPNDFWESTKDIMISYFKNGDMKQGLINGVLNAGKQLKKYFPYNSNDVNELPNAISFGEE